jgi:uncharacterized protein with HEPN domain
MIKNDAIYIEHVLECIKKIKEFTRGMTKDDFFNNIAIQDAVIRNIEVIGEATKKLSKNMTQKHTDIPWSDMAGMRDKLIHGYFDVDIEVVWNTIIIDLPDLQKLISKLKF